MKRGIIKKKLVLLPREAFSGIGGRKSGAMRS